MKVWGALALAAALGLGATAQLPSPAATPDQAAAAGIEAFYSLDYSQAIHDFRQVTAAEPDSASGWNHLAQALLYREMYRTGELEVTLYGKGNSFLARKRTDASPAAIAAFRDANARASACAQRRLATHGGDAHAHYDLAVAWAMLANEQFSLEHAWWSALGDAKRARAEAARAVVLEPQLVDPELIIGVQSYVAGSLPWSARLFTSIVGYRGNKEQGRREIAYVAAHDEHARTDAQVLLAVVDRRDGHNRAAAPILLQLSARYPRNVLFAVEAGEALEAAGEHAAAEQQEDSVLRRAEAGAPGFGRAPLGRLWYDLGDIASVYSRWPEAATDYRHAADAATAPPALRAAARSAAAHAETQSAAQSGHAR